MIKLLENKSIIKFLGIALSILLVIALVPQINTAYGSKDDVPEEGTDATTELVVPEDEETEGVEGEEVVEGTEDADPIEGDAAAIIEQPSSATEIEGEVNDAATAPLKTPKKAARAGATVVSGNKTISTDTTENLTFNDGVSHTLTIESGVTLTGNIEVSNGTQLTIKGTGTIEGTGKGSVITVVGKRSTLVFGEKGNGPTVTGGTGSTAGERANADAELGAGYDEVGGGILVRRVDSEGIVNSSNNNGGKVSAKLILNGGTIKGNTAKAGGGIFIDRGCGFTMNGGTVSGNTATKWEGGGIFLAGNYDGTGEANAKIFAGKIINNTTETRFSWGGGGLFVENMSKAYVGSTIVTNNTAQGLGGGVSGCPHATIGIGTLNETIAVFRNTANKIADHQPHNRWLHNLGTGASPTSGDLYAFGDEKKDWMTVQDEFGPTPGGSYSDTSYVASGKKYSEEAFTAERAMDFYCTKASFVLGNRLVEDASNAPAFTGIKANASGHKLLNVANGEMLAVEGYSVGLTHYLTTHKNASVSLENYAVTISGNTSYTHGGGIGCNGELMFGEFPKNDFVNPYTLSFVKKIVNLNDSSGVGLEGETFNFKLVDKDGKTVGAVTNDKDGQVSFSVKDDTLKSEGPHTRTFTLTEELTNEQKAAGYQSIDPIGVTVKLIVSMAETTNPLKATTTKVYTPTVTSVTFSTGNTAEVVNKIEPKASLELPFSKTIDGIEGGTFKFEMKEVLLSESAEPTSTKPSELTAKEGTALTTKKLEVNSEKPVGDGKFELEYEQNDQGVHWYLITEAKDESKTEVSFDESAYLYKVKVELIGNKTLKATIDGKWKANSASAGFSAIGTNDATVFENVAIKYAGFNLELTKKIITTLGSKLPLSNRTFSFELYEGNPIVDGSEPSDGGASVEGSKHIVTGKTDENGALPLAVGNKLPQEDDPYAKQVYESPDKSGAFTFTLREEKTGDPFMATIPDAKVEITLSASGKRVNQDGHTVFLVTPTVASVKVNGVGVEDAGNNITVTNRYTPNGSWQFKADKRFYGIGSASACSFSMVELDRAPQANEVLGQVPVKPGMEWTASVSAEALKDGREPIVFDAITYQVDGEATESVTGQPQPRDDRGDHFYLITETGNTASKDTTAYVVKVNVAIDETDAGKLVATETMVGYADNINAPLNPSTARPVFYNTDTYDMVAAANYSVYAASGEPVDQVCYVDPKVIKNLEGRSIKSGEFAFKLIEVQNYNDTEGQLISATANDEFGMVDFDKANNVSGDLENPSCLVYSRPGTYYYRVIEDTSQGGMKDQSVVYSDQIITFTTVIEQDEATGQLVCTDMYYGWWDKEAGKNVRYDEQYLDYADQPSNIGDMSKLNTNWHPTITNRTRAMDLQVRKTSVTDRDEGLVGATYALYAVNDNAQGDVMLAEATSEEGGWITYKNVSLTTNNLYYFKEVAAPAGHTVSEFRSPYFYLVEDATSPNGYTLKYADKKDEAASALAAQAEIAAMATEDDEQTSATDAQAADSRAGDDQQPGHSADGNVLLTYDRDGGVYDEATQLDVNKLDTRTHEWVEGAELAIIEKDTGREVVRWTSGKASKQLEKVLNVGTAYILRELKAPENYQVAGDVEFVIDDYGAVSITKGNSNGNAELSGTTITLYDTMLDAEVVDRVERPADGDLAQTGDWLPIAGLASVGLAALIVAIIARRRRIS